MCAALFPFMVEEAGWNDQIQLACPLHKMLYYGIQLDHIFPSDCLQGLACLYKFTAAGFITTVF